MPAIGQTVKRKVDKSVWTVTGADTANGNFILTPARFGAPIAVDAVALAVEFTGAEDVTMPPSEETILRERDVAVAADHAGYFAAGRKRRAKTPEPLPGSPEAVFAAEPDAEQADALARAVAERIKADD